MNRFVDYSLFTASDAEEIIRLLATVFPQLDPPAVAMGLTTHEFSDFVRLYCPKAAAEGLTIIARSTATGEMLGALLSEDSASPIPEGMSRVSEKFRPIFDILGQLDAEYRAGHPVHAGDSVHLFLLGVASSAAGRGVARELVAECLANAVRKGYSVAVTEATNKTSQHIFRKLGFDERVRRSFSEHRFAGQTCLEFSFVSGQRRRIDRRAYASDAAR